MEGRHQTSPRCRNCGRPIVGCVGTFHGGGWVHRDTNREACSTRTTNDSGPLAEPITATLDA